VLFPFAIVSVCLRLPMFCLGKCFFFCFVLISNLFQFKVLRRGGWQKINFRRHESQLSSAKDSRGYLTSPWIQQFTPARKPEGATSPALQECAIQSRGINLKWKKAVLCCPATNSKLSHFGNSFSCHRDFVESNTGALNYVCCVSLKILLFCSALQCFSFFPPYLQLLQQ